MRYGGAKVREVSLTDEYQDYRTKGGEQGKMFGSQGLVFGVGKGRRAADNSQEGGGAGCERLFVAGSARYAGVHAAGFGRPVRRGDHNGLV